MKRIATAVLAVCLLSGTAALADSDHHDDNSSGGHNSGGHNNGGQPHGSPQVHSFQGGPQNVQHNTGPQVFERQFQRGPTNPPNNNGPQIYERHFQGGPSNNNGPQVYEHHFQGGPQGQTFHPQFGAPGFHPGGERPRYNPEWFPHVFHPGDRFHWREGFWRGPPGWYYHTWFYGQILPWGWFAPDWWINDYWDYDLPVPPYGYEWVRNGPDALLVNINSGFVAEVVPGIFY
ncbi:MAG TPA: RcnB family protein [Caulobacteraceae bacterium]|nr:RcnB family protein [Caulobacteraceae bacterium]